jgi:hypothetical protein
VLLTSPLLGIALAWLLCVGVVLAFALALVAAATRADERAARGGHPDIRELGGILEQLEQVRSPTGKRFFPTPASRRELAGQLLHISV